VAIRRVPGNGSRVGAHAERDDAYTRLTTTSSLAGSETAWASSSTTTHASIVCGQNSGQIRGSLYLHLGQRLAAPPHPPIESTPRDPQSEGTPLAREHEREELHAGRNVARERENGVEDGCEEEENGGGGEVEGLEVVEEMTRDCRSGSAGMTLRGGRWTTHFGTEARKLPQTTTSQMKEYPILTGVSANISEPPKAWPKDNPPAALKSSGNSPMMPETLATTKAW
jgi:hypothetical protein